MEMHMAVCAEMVGGSYRLEAGTQEQAGCSPSPACFWFWFFFLKHGSPLKTAVLHMSSTIYLFLYKKRKLQ